MVTGRKDGQLCAGIIVTMESATIWGYNDNAVLETYWYEIPLLIYIGPY